tara:strand:- start:1960 stop:2817 length:858 start_codon:yes stop_codon:yes gene_type:complete
VKNKPTFEELVLTNSGNPRKIWTLDSAKAEKSAEAGHRVAIHYAAPARRHSSMSGRQRTLCPFAGDCQNACIADSGNLGTPTAAHSLMAKATAMVLYPERYYPHMFYSLEVADPSGEAIARGNGTTDEDFMNPRKNYVGGKTIVEANPDRQWSEYTKRRAPKYPIPANIHHTFSWSENPRSAQFASEWLAHGASVAIVVRAHPEEPKPLKSAKLIKQALLDRGTWFGRHLVDGDKSEARHLDPPGSIVLLYTKGDLLRKTQSKFPVYIDPVTLQPTHLSKGLKLS